MLRQQYCAEQGRPIPHVQVVLPLRCGGERARRWQLRPVQVQRMRPSGQFGPQSESRRGRQDPAGAEGLSRPEHPPDFRQESPCKRAPTSVSDDPGSDGSADADLGKGKAHRLQPRVAYMTEQGSRTGTLVSAGRPLSCPGRRTTLNPHLTPAPTCSFRPGPRPPPRFSSSSITFGGGSPSGQLHVCRGERISPARHPAFGSTCAGVLHFIPGGPALTT